ncbi:oligosaccharide flippase family protein [Azospirillum sp. RWY-5-1]|uniref:Oligosaccharide flippase family protein n=1 Tax=Azospirillum oleiclasticum TaxID=2735135 RepID=A0ABX2TL91_9PROT|nr:oligosaccharide flippase family protein [Azospirillum oleiclasticum]NYZ16381.1 oligosaccharide flippase family protein [Azospirillum oleiclasticum]NYZ23903.1 oligosaccharide flippase family protein [Azospirillum oleiclasticum]
MRVDLYSLKVLRRGFVSMMCGRVVSAALTLAAMVLIARGLGVAEFGVYTILLSVLALSITYTGLGLDWVTARYVPEYRIHGSSRDMRRLIAGYLAVRLVTLGLCAGLLLGVAHEVAEWFGIGGHEDEFAIYLLVVLMEGFARAVRGEIFDPMLMPGHSQANAALRGVIFAGLVFAWMQDGLVLHEVVIAEIWASAAAFLATLAQTAWIMARRTQGHERVEGWTPAPIRDMAAIAGHNYVAQLVSSLAGANTLLLVGAAMAGPAAMAGFGFCRTLAEQIRRYLPITILITLARPKIVAAYSVDGRFDRLLDHVQLLYKGNLLVLLPLLVLTVSGGDALLSLLSDGKFADQWLVAAGFVAFLVAQSHRVVLSLLTNILNVPELTSVGSLASVVALPLGAVLLVAGAGPVGLVAALLVGEILSHAVIILALARRGFPYRFDTSGYVRLGLCTAVTMAVTLTIMPDLGAAMPDLGAMALQALAIGGPVLLFGLLVLVAWPFTPFERDAIARLTGLRRKPREPVVAG